LKWKCLVLVPGSVRHSALRAEGKMFSICVDPSLCYEIALSDRHHAWCWRSGKFLLLFLHNVMLVIVVRVLAIVQCCSEVFDVYKLTCYDCA